MEACSRACFEHCFLQMCSNDPLVVLCESGQWEECCIEVLHDDVITQQRVLLPGISTCYYSPVFPSGTFFNGCLRIAEWLSQFQCGAESFGFIHTQLLTALLSALIGTATATATGYQAYFDACFMLQLLSKASKESKEQCKEAIASMANALDPIDFMLYKPVLQQHIAQCLNRCHVLLGPLMATQPK